MLCMPSCRSVSHSIGERESIELCLSMTVASLCHVGGLGGGGAVGSSAGKRWSAEKRVVLHVI